MTEQANAGKITWEKATEEMFLKILEDIPALIRPIAELRVSKKVDSILRDSNRNLVTEKDMVDAFFAETPPGFIPSMKQSMKQLGLDYTKYGHQ